MGFSFWEKVKCHDYLIACSHLINKAKMCFWYCKERKSRSSIWIMEYLINSFYITTDKINKPHFGWKYDLNLNIFIVSTIIAFDNVNWIKRETIQNSRKSKLPGIKFSLLTWEKIVCCYLINWKVYITCLAPNVINLKQIALQNHKWISNIPWLALKLCKQKKIHSGMQ